MANRFLSIDTERLAGLVLALLAVVAILGTALLRSNSGDGTHVKVLQLESDQDVLGTEGPLAESEEAPQEVGLF